LNVFFRAFREERRAGQSNNISEERNMSRSRSSNLPPSSPISCLEEGRRTIRAVVGTTYRG
jgi:hypothetical protein